MKKKKQEFEDDGRTIYSMEELNKQKGYSKKANIYLTTKERIALMKAALLYFFPRFLLVLLCFGIAMVLIYFWLK